MVVYRFSFKLPIYLLNLIYDYDIAIFRSSLFFTADTRLISNVLHY